MRAPRTAALLLALPVALTACSSDDEPRSAPPTPTTPTTQASQARTEAAPPPSVAPADRDRPELRAVRRWAEAYAEAVNAGDPAFAAAAATMTSAGLDRMARYTAIDQGRYLPGPLPVAPVGIREVDADHHVVDACVMTSGWSWASREDRTTWSAQVDPVALHLVREAGRWLVDGREGSDVDCRGVDLPRRLW